MGKPPSSAQAWRFAPSCANEGFNPDFLSICGSCFGYLWALRRGGFMETWFQIRVDFRATSLDRGSILPGFHLPSCSRPNPSSSGLGLSVGSLTLRLQAWTSASTLPRWSKNPGRHRWVNGQGYSLWSLISIIKSVVRCHMAKGQFLKHDNTCSIFVRLEPDSASSPTQ